jgi:hypothetical protein
MFWSIWKTRNRACFDNVLPFDPCDIIYIICHLLDYWCELQKPKVQEGLRQGNDLVKMMLRLIFNRAKGWAPLFKELPIHKLYQECLRVGFAVWRKMSWEDLSVELMLLLSAVSFFSGCSLCVAAAVSP